MNAHITNTDSVLLDSSLTVEGAAADAKAVGDAIDELPKIVNTDEVGADFDLADSDGNVLGKESKFLPNELILLLNKLQYIKTLSINIENVFSDINNNAKVTLETIKYLIILINIQWILPNILVVNFNVSNMKFSNSLIDIMSLKLSQEIKKVNIYERKTYYSMNEIPTYNNYDLILKQKSSNSSKANNDILEQNLNLEIDSSDDEEYSIKDNNKKEISNEDNNIIENKKLTKKDMIKGIYTNYLNKYNKVLDLIIITTYYIRILDKLHALNMKCPDVFSSEIRECYNSINNTKEINFLNLLVDVDHLNILDIEFNSLDFINFEKILGLINANSNLSSLKLIFFSFDKFYSSGGILKILSDINDPNLSMDLLNKNQNFENSVLNQFFLDKFQKNLEILSILLRNRHKSLNELSLLLNIPTLILNNDNYILSLIKFIINVFIFFCFDKNQIKIFKLIAPLINLDNRKTIFLNNLFGKVTPDNLNNVHTLILQFNFYKMNNIINLLSANLTTLSIGNFDLDTFSSLVTKITSDEFLKESKLVNIKIVLNENIIEYDDNIKNNFLKLLQKYPKNLLNFDILTNIKINCEQLHEIIVLIKKSYVNKFIITFNEESESAIKEIIKKDLTYVVNMNKESEQNLKNLTKVLIKKLKVNNEDKNKSVELRKKMFNNIKIMAFDKKEVRFDYN